MPETDDLATRSTRFRTSRYPGTIGLGLNAAGNVIAPGSALPAGAVPPLAEQPTPSLAEPTAPPGPVASPASEQQAPFRTAPIPTVPSIGDALVDTATDTFREASGPLAAATAEGLGAGLSLGESAVRAGSIGGAAAGLGDFSTLGTVPGTAETAGLSGAAADIGGAHTAEQIQGVTELGSGAESTIGGVPSDIAIPGIAGLARAGIGLISGEKPVQAVSAGAGTAAGTAIGAAVGGPVGSFIGGFIGSTIGSVIGGRVICTELVRQGRLDAETVRLDAAFTAAALTPYHVVGYLLWAVPYTRLMRRPDWFGRTATALIEPLARWRIEDIRFELNERDRPCAAGYVVRCIGEPACYGLGLGTVALSHLRTAIAGFGARS